MNDLAFVQHQSSQPSGHTAHIRITTLLGDGGRLADDSETQRQDYHKLRLHCAFGCLCNCNEHRRIVNYWPLVCGRNIAISVCVCLSVCPLAYISKTTSKCREVLCTCYLWLGFGPRTTVQCVMYFRFCGLPRDLSPLTAANEFVRS